MRDGAVFRGKSLLEISLSSKVPHHHLRFCLAEGRVRPEWAFARLARYDRRTGDKLPLELPRASTKRAREDNDDETSSDTPPPVAPSKTHSISTLGLFSTVLTTEELAAKRSRVSLLKDLLIQTTKAVHQMVGILSTPVTEDELLHGDVLYERACFSKAREMLGPLRELFRHLKISLETVILCRDLLTDRDFELIGPKPFWTQLSSEAMRSLLSRVASPSSADVANFFWHKVSAMFSSLPSIHKLDESISDIERLLRIGC